MLDCVILAGGQNTRLTGLVPAYHKPLLIVNGEPLVTRLVRQARNIAPTVTVVVSPRNCEPIMELVKSLGSSAEDNVNYIVQPINTPVSEALRRGLLMCHQRNTLLMCSDNYISTDDWNKFKTAMNNETLVGRKTFSTIGVWSTTQPQLTTRYAKLLPKDHFLDVSPTDEIAHRWEDGHYRCWLGPVIVDTDSTLNAVISGGSRDQIADSLHAAQDSGGQFIPVELGVQDIGVPAALQEATS